MIRGCFIGIALAAAAAAASAAVYLSEDFEGTTFPPAGWQISHLGSGAGGWARAAHAPGYGCQAWASLGYSTSWSNTNIYSRSFTVPPATTVYYYFDYRRWNQGTEPNASFASFSLGSAGRNLDAITPWCSATGSFITSSSGNFECLWSLRAYAGPTTWATTYIEIDNVLVCDYNPTMAVAPTSIGRVKALYR